MIFPKKLIDEMEAWFKNLRREDKNMAVHPKKKKKKKAAKRTVKRTTKKKTKKKARR